MPQEIRKFTVDQVESLEIAPAAERSAAQGWVPPLATDDEVRQALERAFDYRGDVTLTLKNGDKIEGYIFNRVTGDSLANSWVDYFAPEATEQARVSYADIARLEFTGKDCAAGKHWEDWIKKYREKKAKGEKNIALAPEVLD